MKFLSFVAFLASGLAFVGAVWSAVRFRDWRLCVIALLAALLAGCVLGDVLFTGLDHSSSGWAAYAILAGSLLAIAAAASQVAAERERAEAASRINELERELTRFARKSSLEINRAELRFRELARVSPVGFFETDRAGRWQTASNKWHEITGVDRTAAVGRSWLDAVHEVDRARVADAWEKATREGTLFHFEFRVQPQSGAILWVLCQSMPKRDDLGAVTGFIGTVIDITVHKRLQEERDRREAQLQYTQKLEGLVRLAGNVAHEFNNLLTVVLGNVDLVLHEVPVDSPVRDLARQIALAAQRAADLAKQMLSYSGRGSVVLQPVHLTELIRDLTGLLQVSVSRQAVLNFDFSGEPVVKGDATQLRQAIINLVVHASDRLGNDAGFIVVSTGIRTLTRSDLMPCHFGESRPDGAYAFIEVSETGAGMDAETIERLFEPFFQARAGGMGLAAVAAIVGSHAGAIHVRSELGKGSSLTVYLPVTSERIIAAPRAVDLPGPSGPRDVILVVDDEAGIRSVTKRILEGAGFRVLTAIDGFDAVDIMARDGADVSLILLDVAMPRMDGIETLRALRKIRPDARFVLTSGYAEADAIRSLDNTQFNGFIQKPFTEADVVGKIREVLAGLTTETPAS